MNLPAALVKLSEFLACEGVAELMKYLDEHKTKIQKYQVIGGEDVRALMEQLADIIRHRV